MLDEKLTLLPAQIAVVVAEIETVGTTVGFTVITTLLDNVNVGFAHPADEVNFNWMVSLFAKLELV